MLSCAIEYMRAATMGNCKLVLISENISLPLFRRDVAWQFPVQLRLHFSNAPRTVLSSCPLRQQVSNMVAKMGRLFASSPTKALVALSRD